MKKLTIWVILSTWILYVLIPIIFRLVYGYYPKNLQSVGYVPESHMTKAAIIISMVFFVCIIIIHFIPARRNNTIKKTDCRPSYFYFSIGLYLILAITAGVSDYKKAATGELSGSILAYFSLFFYPSILFLIYLFCAKNPGSILILSGSYCMLTLLTNSRSGAVHLGVYLVGYAYAFGIISFGKAKRKANAIYKKYKKQIKLIVLALAIASPFIFIYSTSSRGSITSNASNKAIETIAARCSCLDEAGLALYVSEKPGFENNIFHEKYSIQHQAECIIDSVLPGTLFSGDVDPNQYYRAMVGYMSVKEAAQSYTSMNMMLPIYLVIKYGLITGVLLSVVIIVGLYKIITKMKKSVWQVILILVVFRETLYYFDWVMIWKSFFRGMLTILTFQFFNYCIKMPVIMSGRHRKRMNECSDILEEITDLTK